MATFFETGVDGTDFDSFLNHEFLHGGDDKEDEPFRGMAEVDSPSSDAQFLSPVSLKSELTDVTPADFGAPASDPAGHNSAFAHDMPAYELGQQTYAHAPAASIYTFGHGLPSADQFGSSNGAASHAFPQPGTEMWRSTSDGAMLSQSIRSLALENHNSGQSGPYPFPQHHRFMEENLNSLSLSFNYPVQPSTGTPMQPTHSLPAPGMLSPPSEKKRKLSPSQAQPLSHPNLDGASGSAPRPKAATPKKSGRKKTKNVEHSPGYQLPVEGNSIAECTSGSSPASALTSGPADLDSDATSKPAKKSNAKRAQPSAAQVTEAGRPFPVIDTSAKHSSLFVPPDTTGLTKREARLVKNRAAAFLSRQRKREKFEELEVKCKAMSIMAWRMWEVIAGPNAPIERLQDSVLPALLSSEDPMASICLEQIIAKQGASIAPTADEAPALLMRDGEEPETCPSGAAASADVNEYGISSRPWQADAIDKLGADLAAARDREQSLVAELEALRRTAAPAVAMHEQPVLSDSTLWQSNPAPAAVAPFKDSKPFGHSLTIAPDLAAASSPLQVAQAATAGSSPGTTRIKMEETDSLMDFAATPTIETFSEAARKHKSTQLSRVPAPLECDVDARSGPEFARLEDFADASIPSSPSSLSSASSDATHRGHANAHLVKPKRTASSMALMVILFSIALLGMPSGDLAKLGISRSNGTLNSGFSLGQVLGPVEPTTQYSLIRRTGDDEDEDLEDKPTSAAPASASASTSARPSSHLSDSDLRLGFADADMHDESSESNTGPGDSLGSSAVAAIAALAAISQIAPQKQKKGKETARPAAALPAALS